MLDASSSFRPLTATEAIVASIWRELLNLDDVDPDANFFEVGGYSLAAAQAVHEIAVRTGVHLELETFFEQGSIAEIARAVDQTPDQSPSTVGAEEEL